MMRAVAPGSGPRDYLKIAPLSLEKMLTVDISNTGSFVVGPDMKQEVVRLEVGAHCVVHF